MELSTNTAKNLPEEDNKETGESVQYIVIRLGNEQYGIDIRDRKSTRLNSSH